jgi:predicted DNA-binding ribbon-helix-helix protein
MLRESQVCSKEDAMKSLIIKRSVVVDGHKTSISLEDEFWSGLKEIAQAQGASVAQTVTEIDTTRQQGNLSSAIRLFVLGHIHDQKMRAASDSKKGPLLGEVEDHAAVNERRRMSPSTERSPLHRHK